MDCDAFKKLLITDLDGTVIDGGAGTAISEGAFEWEGDPRRGLGYNRVPSSLYTTPDGDPIPFYKEEWMPNAGKLSKNQRL